MDREEFLKMLIQNKYGNVKLFSEQIGIPYTTVRSILERGVGKAGVDNIIKICKGLGISPEDLAENFVVNNFTANTINVMNKLEEIRKEKVYNFAEKQLEQQNKIVHLDEVRELYADYQTQYEDVDVYGAVSAGTGVELYDEVVETIQYPAPVPNHDIALKVSGDSMAPLFQDGEVIFVRKKQEINNGQIGVFIVNGQGFLKKLYKGSDAVKLISLNPNYEDIVLTEHDDIHVVGVVVI
ncbi:cI-like repressor [Aerococcaceae bacterium zg-ZJ1578]|uniref:helix-turn-helix domain-containing protein n=1 Tax=Aerococcaceae bacterium zg-252 TaxID=2796928 RepID=UPI001A2ACDA4|nr:cI-like repressor [Aerococcaceae bacterium zg-1578]